MKFGVYLNLQMQGPVHRYEKFRENNQREDFFGWQEGNYNFKQF